jgi:peptidoglycan/xylan/chitin deacetylase (PgdA/CDA1 family)
VSKNKHGRDERPNLLIIVAILIFVITFGVGFWTTRYYHHQKNHAATSTQPVHYTTGDEAPQATAPTVTATKYSVPILMYHYIRTVTDPKDKLGFNLSVTPSNFDQQLSWLNQNGYHTISLTNFCTANFSTDTKPVVITFDDGYDDAYSAALPALQKYQMTGTFFIVSGFTNHPRYLTSTQIQTMQTNGMEIGAHTVHHLDLASISATKQFDEISQSAGSTKVFAYPAGKYNSTTISEVKKAGDICAVTTLYGFASDKSPLYELPRIRISGTDSLTAFIDKMIGKR